MTGSELTFFAAYLGVAAGCAWFGLREWRNRPPRWERAGLRRLWAVAAFIVAGLSTMLALAVFVRALA